MLKHAGFYMARLRRATSMELMHRLKQAGIQMHARRLARHSRPPCRISQIHLSDVRSLKLPDLYGAVTWQEVERILAGFRFTLSNRPEDIAASESELTRRVCVSTRSVGNQADIRAIWEPARLQHVAILVAWLLRNPFDSSSWRVKEFVRSETLGWLTRNPFLYGPHYLSAMECGLRVPVFFYAMKLLDNLSDAEAAAILKAVYLHAWWIEKNLSLHSSLGNHTVCEAMGLVFAGGIYRRTAKGQEWLTRGVALLKQELSHQVLQDGGPVEQAFGYHRFVLDIYGLSVDFLETNNLKSCNEIRERLLKGEAFLESFRDVGGTVPAVGDYDDGYAVAPGLSPRRPKIVEQCFYHRSFHQAGYTVIRGQAGLRIVFDHGPLGMSPLYNHGHADALSVTLSIAGIPFLIDSGTYRYNNEPAWRRYFKSTRAHNTVTIDGFDQADQVTGFVWDRPYTTTFGGVVEQGGRLSLEAENDGYGRLAGKVRHRRMLLVDPGGAISIHDSFSGSGEHYFELNFHFHPDVHLVPDGDGWRAVHGGYWLRMSSPAGQFDVHRGEQEPPLGWYSASYGIREPAPVLQLFLSGEPDSIRFETVITMGMI